MVLRELTAVLGLDIDQTAFDKAQTLLEGLSKGFVAFGSAFVAGLTVSAALIAKTTANAGDEVRKLSQRVGVNSIQLQELAYAGDLADLSMEELAVGLQHLAKGGAKDVRKEFLKLADQFAAMPDGGEKTAIALTKLGRAGARAIPLLNGGSKAIAELAQEAHDLGVIIGEEDQQASEEFNDQLTRLWKAIIGIRNAIGLTLIRPLTRMVVLFRQLITQLRIGGPMIEKLTLAMRTFAFVLTGIVAAALLANAAGVATNVSWFVALGVAAVRSAVAASIAWLRAASPVIAMGLVIALVLLAFEDLYYFLTGKGKSAIGDFFKYVKDEFGDMKNFLRAIGDWVADWSSKFYANIFGERVGGALKSMIKHQFNGLGIIAEGAGKGLNFLQNLNADQKEATATRANPFGEAAAPTNANTVNGGPQFNATITVNAAPGVSAKEIADQTVQSFDEIYNARMRAAYAGSL